jgi:hypothetical protein
MRPSSWYTMPRFRLLVDRLAILGVGVVQDLDDAPELADERLDLACGLRVSTPTPLEASGTPRPCARLEGRSPFCGTYPEESCGCCRS